MEVLHGAVDGVAVLVDSFDGVEVREVPVDGVDFEAVVESVVGLAVLASPRRSPERDDRHLPTASDPCCSRTLTTTRPVAVNERELNKTQRMGLTTKPPSSWTRLAIVKERWIIATATIWKLFIGNSYWELKTSVSIKYCSNTVRCTIDSSGRSETHCPELSSGSLSTVL